MVTKKEDKKEHIIDTAERVFGEFGYEGASTRLLASEAGVNMAMLNYYFGSKDGLLRAVLERRISSMRAVLEDIYQQPITNWQKLERMIEAYLNRVLTNNCFHRLVQRELSLAQRHDTADLISEHVFLNLKVMRQVIVDGMADGTFREVDAEMTIASVIGTKYYLLNSTDILSRLLNADMQDKVQLEEVIKPRVKKHLLSLLKSYLLKQNEEK
ncbi:TetR/AcrR family transcriptional regulator [Pontibacter mangrovi]|uniref:TetR/AcrR family transcriptional regulator n=1 Tax=Pontibacter mangrovi TaxID=2589816 RepID=A0A501WBX3_9BACT|nr:TetR/AcrR family transcriptional regulator [Pontibacter mangrovi]TPE46015.1 TetR/AcrR family transcriptional regulator [Pontibacter mangrovi]